MEKEKSSLNEFTALERQRLRTLHRKIRSAMTPEQVRGDSSRICNRLQKSDLYAQSSVIYGYYPLGNEVDCRPLLRQALLDGKTVALPRMGQECRMDFYQITDLGQVAEGSFHVMEPLPECRMLSGQEALVLVPGVVFGRDGGRYGYGKGCYDRYFARFSRLIRLGLAYEHQLEERLEVLESDVAMNYIYTEQGTYRT
ncbi:MAG: 5-formyltetrahydrofolate cyclo-ligase [Roseburia sp.]